MGVIADKLIKEYNGTPAGTVIQVLDKKHKELTEQGYFEEDSLTVAENKKKSEEPEKVVVSGAEGEIIK